MTLLDGEPKARTGAVYGINCDDNEQIPGDLPDGVTASPAGEAEFCHLNAAELHDIGA